MSGVRMLHFLKDWWKSIQIANTSTLMALKPGGGGALAPNFDRPVCAPAKWKMGGSGASSSVKMRGSGASSSVKVGFAEFETDCRTRLAGTLAGR